jgi:chromate reductase, NAD(P)H dehydrogenase (quinone)
VQNVLAIAGSLRRGSYNRLLIRAAASSAPEGMAITPYDDLAAIPLFDEDLETATNGGPEAVAGLRRRLAAADGVLIATPEYNWSIPGVLKNTVDWLSRPPSEALLAGKAFAVIGATAGRWGTRLAQAALRQVLCATESAVMPAPALFVSDAAARFDEHGDLRDDAVRAHLRSVLDAFGEWMAAHRSGRQ